MAFVAARMAALHKLQASTYGTDAAPGSTDALVLSNVQWTPFEGTVLERGLAKPFPGGDVRPIVNQVTRMRFDVQLFATTAADTPAPYGGLLRSCALAEVVDEETAVDYVPVDSGFEHGSLHFFNAGSRQKIHGLRGSVGLTFARDQFPIATFDMLGIYEGPTAQAFPTQDKTAWLAPKPVSKINTPTFSLHSYSAALHSLTLNMNNNVFLRDMPNHKEIDLIRGEVTGSVTIDWPPQGTKDYLAIIKDSLIDTLSLIHGTGAGNILQLGGGRVQLMNPQPGEAEGYRTLTMDLSFLPDEGNDEFTFSTK